MSRLQWVLAWLLDLGRFFLQDFLTRFCYHTVLPLTLLALAGLVWGSVLEEYGARWLVFHEHPGKQLLAGFALALVGLHCLYVGYVLDTEKRERCYSGPFGGYALRIVGLLTAAAFVLFGLYRMIVSYVGVPRAAEHFRPVTQQLADLWFALDALPFTTGSGLGLLFATLVLYPQTLPQFMARWTGKPTPPESSATALAVILALSNGAAVLLGTALLSIAWMILVPSYSLGIVIAVLLGVALAPMLWLERPARALTSFVQSGAQIMQRIGEIQPFRLVLLLPRLIYQRISRAFTGEGVFELPYQVGLFILVGAFGDAFVLAAFLTNRLENTWMLYLFFALFVGVAVLGLALAFPSVIWSVYSALGDNDNFVLDTPERPVNRNFIVFSLAAMVTLASMSLWCSMASPLTVLATAWIGILALYTVLYYWIRRGLPVVLAAMGILLILGGLNPYKQRLPGLEYYYQGDHSPDLQQLAEADLKRNQQFQEKWNAYWPEIEAIQQGTATQPEEVEGQLKRAMEIDEALAPLRIQMQENQVIPGRPTYAFPRTRPSQKEGYTRDDVHRVLTATDDLELWAKDAQSDLCARRPLVLIAVSGGGLCAAAWTYRVLMMLEKELARQGIDLGSHVRLITGASGGMLGAAYYVTTLPRLDERSKFLRPREQAEADWEKSYRGRQEALEAGYQAIVADFLTELSRTLVFHDLPWMFSPWPAQTDRGRTLEEAWQKLPGGPGPKRPLEWTFGELQNREMSEEYALPSLVFSPMMVEDGRRFLISNLDLGSVVSNDGSRLTGPGVVQKDLRVRNDNFSCDGLELFRLFPEAQARFKLSTAVRLSASFPLFSPAVPLPTYPRRRVVDAGYYDNYGVAVATSWLFSERNRIWIENQASKVLFIQIRDGTSDPQRRLGIVRPDDSNLLSRSLEEVTSPLEGLENARVSSSSFRNDGQLELLSNYFRTKVDDQSEEAPCPDQPLGEKEPYFTTLTIEYSGNASTSWYLTGKEKESIVRSAVVIPSPDYTEVALNNWATEIAKDTRDRRSELDTITSERISLRMQELRKWWRAPVARWE